MYIIEDLPKTLLSLHFACNKASHGKNDSIILLAPINFLDPSVKKKNVAALSHRGESLECFTATREEFLNL
jgi:hypothetical protein